MNKVLAVAQSADSMRTDDLDFFLPPELIAQQPSEAREASRLMHYCRSERSIAHRRFSALPDLLNAGDLLVFNDTRVLPARFLLTKPTGGQVEALFLSEQEAGRWRVLLKNLGPFVASTELAIVGENGGIVRVLEKLGGGEFAVEVQPAEPARVLLDRIGRMPLPPYIKRRRGQDDRDAADRERYQTVFAKHSGSVAAPTAALHFSESVLERLEARGVRRTFVTLHVGMGTFKPVAAETLAEHAMHREWYTLGGDAAAAINAARADGRRVIAVGTTACRVLESQPPGPLHPVGGGETSIFIYPPYRWKHVDALVTNFHLPRSTLIALVAALVGLDEQRRMYAEAISQRYRFFSYGDAMFIE